MNQEIEVLNSSPSPLPPLSTEIPLQTKTKYLGVIFVSITIIFILLSSAIEGSMMTSKYFLLLSIISPILLVVSLFRKFGSNQIYRNILLVYFFIQGMYLIIMLDLIMTPIISFVIALSYIPSMNSKIAKILTPYYKEKEKLLPSYHINPYK